MLLIKRSAESWVEFQQQKEDVVRDGASEVRKGRSLLWTAKCVSHASFN